MKTIKYKGRAQTRSISLPEELAAAADERAENQHRTFSNYIKNLIAEDVSAAAANAEEVAQ